MIMNIQLTLRQLEIFEEIIKARSYTVAAHQLGMTQPAISMQIKKLEKAIGLKLFEKHGRQVELTHAGERIHGYSEQIHAQHEGLQEVIYELNNQDQGFIKVSAATTANHLIVSMLAEFSRKNQGISVMLDITNRKDLLSQLDKYEPDLVIMGEPPASLNLESERLIKNPLVVIAATDHPLAKQKQIPFKKIKDEKFVVREDGSGTKSAIERFFNEHNSEFKSKLALGSNEAIRHAVMGGLGIGIVSLHSIKLELETNRLTILDVEHFPILRNWHIVKRKGKGLLPAAEKFQNFIQSEAQEYAKEFQQFID